VLDKNTLNEAYLDVSKNHADYNERRGEKD
jgi:hypothetical protein